MSSARVKVKTSIVTCSFNMRHWLPTAIASVLTQTSNDWEYLILDDGSFDGTWAYLLSLPVSPQIRLLRNHRRQGIAKSRERLLRSARGEFISILDADDVLAPQKTQWHALLLEKHPDVGVVWGRSYMWDLRHEPPHEELFPRPGFFPAWDLAQDYSIAHSASTWRKSAMLQAGGYNLSLSSDEDVDLFLKVGDFSRQLFCGTIVAGSRIDNDKPFDRHASPEARLKSRQLVNATLKRRYGAPLT